jgi:hypothetical protein
MAEMHFYVRVGEGCYTEVSCERFYSEGIRSYSPDDYEDIIGWDKTEFSELSPDQLKEIWRWKSSQWGEHYYKLSLPKLNEFNEFRRAQKPSLTDLRAFWEEVAKQVSRTGFIYQAFAVHIARPSDYPMVDQHVYRAYLCISSEPPRVVLEPPEVQPNCTSFYVFCKRYELYQEFWFAMMKQLGLSRNDVADNRRLDTAIRNFGIQLLKDYRQPNEIELRVE